MYRLLNLQNKSAALKTVQKNDDLKGKTRFVVLDNLVWNVYDKDLRLLLKAIISTKATKSTTVPVPEVWSGLNLGQPEQDEIAVQSMHTMVDVNGFSTGNALIKCASPEVATKVVMECHGKMVHDRMVVADWIDEEGFKQMMHGGDDVSMFNVAEFSSVFSGKRMQYLNEQMFGMGKIGRSPRNKGPQRSRRGSRNERQLKLDNLTRERNKNRATENTDLRDMGGHKNKDIAARYKKLIKQKRNWRRLILRKSRRSAIDTDMLGKMRNGVTRRETRPKTRGQLNEQRMKGKKGITNLAKEFNMTPKEMLKYKEKINWNTGNSRLAEMIVKKKTIHLKDYWADSIKHNRRRNHSNKYIQNSVRHGAFRNKSAKMRRKNTKNRSW